VDIPRSVGVDTKQMIGRLVGIRTVSQRLSSSARVPIAVAASVVDLTPRASAQRAAGAGHVSRTANNLAENVNTIPEAAPTDARDQSPQGPAVAGVSSLEEDE
jgi:hypothetical protein